jgi:GT2 family glycosyltransferase
VQALNGYRFNVWTGAGTAIHDRLPASAPFDAATVVAATDFVLGASLAVSRAFLEQVGLMEDSYFLYFEEIDWAMRNRRRGGNSFTIGFAAGATVYHKEGGSIGSSGVKGQRSLMAEYWLNRSRLAFIRRHYPVLLPWHWLFTLALVGRRLVRRQPEKARVLLKAMTAR